MADIFDERIKGYGSIKNTARELADILRRSDEYRSRGVVLPVGLLLEGVPGTGKSTLARCLAEASGRYVLTFHRLREGNEFLEDLSNAFEEAAEHAPSLIILEDIHTYSTNVYGPEWAALQAHMDECEKKDIFVAAATNTMEFIPDSLLRPGRFDRILQLEAPRGKTAEEVMEHYLQGKNLSPEICLADLAKVLDGYSCAVLEKALNLAAIHAVYDGSDTIGRDHLVDALMEVVYRAWRTDMEYTPEEMKYLATHEAAHAVVCEILNPGNLAVVSILASGNESSGFTGYCQQGFSDEQGLMDLVTVSLTGKAATEVLLGKFDIGAEEDLRNAHRYLIMWACSFAGGGFNSLETKYHQVSEAESARHELLISAKMEEMYQRAKGIVFEKRKEIEKVRDRILEKETLLNSEVKEIMDRG